MKETSKYSQCNFDFGVIETNLRILYIHKFDLMKVRLPIILNEYKTGRCSINPLNYPSIYRAKGLPNFAGTEDAIDKVAQEYSCMIPFITDEINKVISEMHYASTIIAYAPSNSLNIEINGAERIFKKSRDTKSSNGNTSDNELWESISCDFGRNPEITELILIDDCVSSGRTANIAKNKFEEKNGQSVNASVIAVLFDPPPAPLDMTKFEPT